MLTSRVQLSEAAELVLHLHSRNDTIFLQMLWQVIPWPQPECGMIQNTHDGLMSVPSVIIFKIHIDDKL